MSPHRQGLVGELLENSDSTPKSAGNGGFDGQPRKTKKRKLDVCDSGFRGGPAEKSEMASVMTDPGLSSGLDPGNMNMCDRAESVMKASLAGCILTRKRLLATCRSNVSAFRIIHYHKPAATHISME